MEAAVKIGLLTFTLLSLVTLTMMMPMPLVTDIHVPLNTEEEGDYFQGDIILSPWQKLDRSVVLDPSMTWKDGIVYYTIDKTYSFMDKQKIMSALQDFHRYTCIRWVPRTNQEAYVHIMNQEGCASPVGFRNEEIVLRLHSTGCLTHHGTILHELMHVLGFWHEHTRHDRDNYVTVFWNNIKEGKKHDFQTHGLDETQTLGLPYDYWSVLHYNRYTFSLNGVLPTLLPWKNVPIGQRIAFSQVDLAKINRLYKCVGYYMGNDIPGAVKHKSLSPTGNEFILLG